MLAGFLGKYQNVTASLTVLGTDHPKPVPHFGWLGRSTGSVRSHGPI